MGVTLILKQSYGKRNSRTVAPILGYQDKGGSRDQSPRDPLRITGAITKRSPRDHVSLPMEFPLIYLDLRDPLPVPSTLFSTLSEIVSVQALKFKPYLSYRSLNVIYSSFH